MRVSAIRVLRRACCIAFTLATGCQSTPSKVSAVAPPAPLPRSLTSRSYATLDSGATRLTIFLATTRRGVQSDRASDRFGPDDADSLQFAAVGVNVPPYSARGTG